MFYRVKDPPQWMLDNLLRENREGGSQCPDCGVSVGEKHLDGCDVARCPNTGIQRLQCVCAGGCPEDIWTSLWPGIQTAYDRKLVCYDTAMCCVGLDLNAATIVDQLEKSGADEQDIQEALADYWDNHM